MTGAPHAPRRHPSPLGCRLHDWDLTSREGVMPAPSTEARGIIFDLDDTLYPHEHFVRSGFMAVARHVERAHGVGVTETFAKLVAARRSGSPRRELQAVCARHGLALSLVPQLLDVFRTHRPVLRLPPVAAAVLTRLRLEGWRLVVLTNGPPRVQRAKVSALGLTRFVDGVICAEEHATGGKPAAPAFIEALRRLSVPARRCVCVGNDPVCDIAGAQRLGIRTVQLVTTASQRSGSADRVIDSLEAVPGLASQLLEAATLDAA
jgi:putative hydrolase of the HAD superfamily